MFPSNFQKIRKIGSRDMACQSSTFSCLCSRFLITCSKLLVASGPYIPSFYSTLEPSDSEKLGMHGPAATSNLLQVIKNREHKHEKVEL